MNDIDQLEKLRIDARNELEEFMFEVREDISVMDNEDGDMIWNIFTNYLSEIESWLYNNGEKCKKLTYENLLATLRQFNIQEKIDKSEDQIKVDIQAFKERIDAITTSHIDGKK